MKTSTALLIVAGLAAAGVGVYLWRRRSEDEYFATEGETHIGPIVPLANDDAWWSGPGAPGNTRPTPSAPTSPGTSLIAFLQNMSTSIDTWGIG